MDGCRLRQLVNGCRLRLLVMDEVTLIEMRYLRRLKCLPRRLECLPPRGSSDGRGAIKLDGWSIAYRLDDR